ncbi:hypothetical protein PUT78_11085 [Roseinatronobacter sp. HJB301]|uniref:DUF3313 domain-containing protein n=1 Tax=Roseinatronobacter alkalisoli TaxID=3028235 RepID=A0ABT5T949_9RHOB|nr:hypothetical protein [Roseinatronobacter sp. HJB301]
MKTRICGALAALALLGACTSGAQLGEERSELGDFRLGHAIVVTDGATIGPASRRADPGVWESTLTDEVQRRFGRYDGDKYYHIAIAVQGYVLAIPGIPIVAAPKSVLILGVTIWDDAAQKKLNDTPHRITVLESLSGETVISSGLTQSAEEQMQNLSENAVAAIERWMATKTEWFPPRTTLVEPEVVENAPPDAAASES